MRGDFVYIVGVVVQSAEDGPGFFGAALRDEPAGGFGDPEAADEKDEGGNACECYGAAPAESEIFGEEAAEADPGGDVVP